LVGTVFVTGGAFFAGAVFFTGTVFVSGTGFFAGTAFLAGADLTVVAIGRVAVGAGWAAAFGAVVTGFALGTLAGPATVDVGAGGAAAAGVAELSCHRVSAR
jgi:hypothetical protein